jgi:prophage antirepressor-like protein
MNEIVKLYKDNPVRIVEKDGEPWFVAKDVCSVLGIRNNRDALATLAVDERDDVGITDAIGRKQETTIVSEPGLYRLVFKSRKKEAESFKRWVCHEVLPAIRKTGAYLAPGITIEQIQNVLATIVEQLQKVIQINNIQRQQLEYAQQFIPNTEYGSTSPINGQRRTTIRRGANVAGKGRLIEKRNPDEIGYQLDLFDDYQPMIIVANAVNLITNSNVKQLGTANG